MRRFLREFLLTIGLAIVIFLLLQTTVQSFVVVGSSMEPNLEEKERLLINKVVYRLHEPERGDIIVFRPPGNKRADYVKRIIALPGETVAVSDGRVYINGSPLDEAYEVKELPRYTLAEQRVPEDEYFVLGDNRNNSNDSHNGWTVPGENIVGKAWLAIWPPGSWGVVANHSAAGQLAGLAGN